MPERDEQTLVPFHCMSERLVPAGLWIRAEKQPLPAALEVSATETRRLLTRHFADELQEAGFWCPALAYRILPKKGRRDRPDLKELIASVIV